MSLTVSSMQLRPGLSRCMRQQRRRKHPPRMFLLTPLLFPLISLVSSPLLLPLSPAPTPPSLLLNHALIDDSLGVSQLHVAVSAGTRAAASATVLNEVTAAEQVYSAACAYTRVHHNPLTLNRAFRPTCSCRRRACTPSLPPHGPQAAKAGLLWRSRCL